MRNQVIKSFVTHNDDFLSSNYFPLTIKLELIWYFSNPFSFMKSLVFLTVLIPQCLGSASEASTADETLPSFPPRPPRLVRQTRHWPDECRRLCFAFMAHARGDGFDLCNNEDLSSCEITASDPYCEYLYWSVTENGEPGLVYSVDGSDLTLEERDHPLRCEDAERILDE